MLGITIGIWSLVVFGSMANKINGYVASGSDYYVGKIIVSDASAGGIGVGLVGGKSPREFVSGNPGLVPRGWRDG